jgi:hypothetical protein
MSNTFIYFIASVGGALICLGAAFVALWLDEKWEKYNEKE